jgi:hypothetical protein
LRYPSLLLAAEEITAAGLVCYKENERLVDILAEGGRIFHIRHFLPER